MNRVELKNIDPPMEIQTAMERQMKAERERREAILRAEGEKRSAILVAEGEKESAILRAEAVKQSTIREAEGKAEGILKINQAKAEGLRVLKAVEADQALIALRSLETMEKVADGKATKLIIPSELQNLATLGASLKEIIRPEDSEK